MITTFRTDNLCLVYFVIETTHLCLLVALGPWVWPRPGRSPPCWSRPNRTGPRRPRSSPCGRSGGRPATWPNAGAIQPASSWCSRGRSNQGTRPWYSEGCWFGLANKIQLNSRIDLPVWIELPGLSWTAISEQEPKYSSAWESIFCFQTVMEPDSQSFMPGLGKKSANIVLLMIQKHHNTTLNTSNAQRSV